LFRATGSEVRQRRGSDFPGPSPGDHVLFSGVVWKPLYSKLFSRLHEDGIDFSVLIHDIIPVERPDLVPDTSHRTFAEWLGTAVSTASLIFVSSKTTAQQLRSWADRKDPGLKPQIVPIIFGGTELVVAPEGSVSTIFRRPPPLPFVLAVGTI